MSGEELKPAAWMYCSSKNTHCFAERADETSIFKRQRGWTETPLYAHPLPEQPQEGESLSSTAALEAEIAFLKQRLESVRHWVASLTVTDMNEIVADNGITAGMVVGQEAREQLRRIDATLTPKTKKGR